MSEATSSQIPPSDAAEIHSAVFAQLVLQQTNMAMMLMGKVAHPETGKTMKDMQAAKYFIDVLEMLEAKTKGNLGKEESSLLKQSLMSLRLTFVEEVDTPVSPPEPAPQPASESAGKPEEASPSKEEEHRKKFSKKY